MSRIAVGKALRLFVLSVLLSGCASVAMAPRDQVRFDLLGRALVSYSDGAVTANVRWEHAARQDEIWLMTPMGQTLAHIVDNGREAVLTRADGGRHTSGSVETLTRTALGWPLPLSQMQYWIRGLPVPNTESTGVQRDAAGRLTAITQNHWSVRFTYHPADGEHAGLIRRLDLRDGANEIRFVVDTWRESGRT